MVFVQPKPIAYNANLTVSATLQQSVAPIIDVFLLLFSNWANIGVPFSFHYSSALPTFCRLIISESSYSFSSLFVFDLLCIFLVHELIVLVQIYSSMYFAFWV